MPTTRELRSWLAAVPGWSTQQLVPRPPCGAAYHGAVAGNVQAMLPEARAAPRPSTVRCIRQAPGRGAAVVAVVAAAPPHTAAVNAPEPRDATEARLYALYDFAAAHGRPPAPHEAHCGIAIGAWAEACRQDAARSELDARLVGALASIPGWNWDCLTPDLAGEFEDSLAVLKAFVTSHARLPRTRRSHANTGSAAAAAATTMAANAAIEVMRRQRLMLSPSAVDHNNGSTRAVAPVAAATAVLEEKAATEICRRLAEQRKRGVLTNEQIQRVAAELPGWRWDSRVRAPPLDKVLLLLVQFHAAHGRLPRQTERLPNGFQLGEWCTARRGEHARGVLEADVAAALMAKVPGWSWRVGDAAFESSLAVLRRFVAAHGRTPSQRETHDGVRIGAWCNKRRLQYRSGLLPADRAAALEAVPGWWWAAEELPD